MDHSTHHHSKLFLVNCLGRKICFDIDNSQY